MTTKQWNTVARLLKEYAGAEFHHGDCVGADRQAHYLAQKHGLVIVLHPPEKLTKRAFCMGAVSTRKPRPYLDRNKDIVNESDVLIATPYEHNEILRSGTWSTVRYAWKTGKDVYLIRPDGGIEVQDDEAYT